MRPDEVRLSAAVMTHPQRRCQAERLRDRHPELDLRVVVDPAPEAAPSALRTARVAWGAVGDGATHHLVLQDDAAPSPDLPAVLTEAIAAAPDQALSLFTEWGSETSYSVRLALLRGQPFAEVVDDYLPSVGLVLPAAHARGFAEFTGFDGPQDDVALRRYLAAEGVTVRIAAPNLVDHEPSPSLFGTDYLGPRRSVCPLPPGTEVSWTDPVSTVDALPYFCWVTAFPVCVVRDPTSGHGWSRRSVQTLFTRYGLAPGAVARQSAAAVAEFRRIAPDVDQKMVFGLWVSAYGLGVVHAGIRPEEPGSVLDQPLIAHALATVGPGGLKRFVAQRRITELAGPLHDLVVAGVAQGQAALAVRSA